jgi:hypothetical protein
LSPHITLDFSSQHWQEVVSCLRTSGFDIHPDTSE